MYIFYAFTHSFYLSSKGLVKNSSNGIVRFIDHFFKLVSARRFHNGTIIVFLSWFIKQHYSTAEH